jgi:E3 ubiquitin-protein ligase RNF14
VGYVHTIHSQVADGAVEGLRCVDPGCRAPVPPYVLQSLLTAEQYARWETLLLQRTLDKVSWLC